MQVYVHLPRIVKYHPPNKPKNIPTPRGKGTWGGRIDSKNLTYRTSGNDDKAFKNEPKIVIENA